MGTPVLGVAARFSLKPFEKIHPLWGHFSKILSTVPTS